MKTKEITGICIIHKPSGTMVTEVSRCEIVAKDITPAEFYERYGIVPPSSLTQFACWDDENNTADDAEHETEYKEKEYVISVLYRRK